MNLLETGSKALRSISFQLISKYDQIPVLRDTQEQMGQMFEKNEYDQDFFQLTEIILRDPFLVLKLMKIVAHKKRLTLDQEVDNIKDTMLILGMKKIFDLVANSNVAPESEGLTQAIKRARYAAKLAKFFAEFRHDIDPEEVAISVLLADLGELMLWVFKPELPMKVREAMLKGFYTRNQEAQLALCKFKFKDVSICLTQEWELPSHILNLMNSDVALRAKLAKTVVDLSRHVHGRNGYLAIPDDLKEFKKIMNFNNYDLILQKTELQTVLTAEQFSHVQSML